MKTQADPVKKVRDPVCGMRFKPDKAASIVEYRGRTIFFCADACRRQFEADPKRYVNDDESPE